MICALKWWYAQQRLRIRDSQCRWKHWNNTEYVSGTVVKDGEIQSWKGVCNLGSIVLPAFFRLNEDGGGYFDYERLEEVVCLAVRALDNIIDKNFFPHEDYAEYQRNMRTIGLGITGLGDLIALHGHQYGSFASGQLVEKVMGAIAYTAYRTSIELAKEKGPFPMCDREKFAQSEYLERRTREEHDGLGGHVREWQEIIEGIKEHGIRNARLLSIAPTGTMSLVWGNNCSSGLEPIFAKEQERIVNIGGQGEKHKQKIILRDPVYEFYQKDRKVGQPEIEAERFVTALELPVRAHVDTLRIVAGYVDMSCSKTINIPADYSFEETQEVYKHCWMFKIKGCTIFRPNPLRAGVLSEAGKDKDQEEGQESKSEAPESKVSVDSLSSSELVRGEIVQVDDNVIGRERHLQTGCGTLHFQAYFDPDTGALMEAYASRGSQGGCNSYMTALSRMISLAARAGTPVDAIIDQLLSAPPCIAYNNRHREHHDTSKGMSCAAAMGYALRDMANEIKSQLGLDCVEEIDVDVEATPDIKVPVKAQTLCPDCGEPLVFEGGCNICKSCGWSKCG